MYPLLPSVYTGASLPTVGGQSGPYATTAYVNPNTSPTNSTGMNAGEAPYSNEYLGPYSNEYFQPADTTNTSGPTKAELDAAAAEAAEAARIDTLRSQFNAQKQGAFDSADQWLTNYGTDLNRGIIESVRGLGQKQQGIDRFFTDNEAKKMQGTTGILGMIGRGVKSAGTYLGGRNAGSSSAAGEIAKAYGDVGRRQMSVVGNQYAAGNEQGMIDQGNLDWEKENYSAKFKEQMDREINTKTLELKGELERLNAAMAEASLPDRIAIEQEIATKKNQFIASLQQYDNNVKSGVAGVKGQTTDQYRTKANENLAAGQAPADMFSFTDQVPMQLQNSGPSASGLPIYTNPTKKQLA